ncbi:NUDIX domain-containing protein [Solitalea koreensis]|nr:NUDIX domain-containing protein [Solitalea koreensis]
MPQKSAGILLYRFNKSSYEVLLVHPGGPFWSKKDLGAWSIPKGEFSEHEEPLSAARREFTEEIGMPVTGEFIQLTSVKQKGGKVIYAWALQGSINTEHIKCNTFEIEWPPKSGKKQEFPEIDKAEWFSFSEAKQKINPSQAAFIDELINRLNPTL